MKFKTLGSLIPVGAYSLAREFNLFLILAHQLTQTEIGYLYFALVENYVLRLQIVVNDLLLLISQVL